MTEHIGRRRSPRSFANTVAARSIPRKARCRTTVDQIAEKQPALQELLRLVIMGMVAATVADKLKQQILPPLNREQLAVMKLLTTPDPIWRSKDGTRVHLSKMSGNHLCNAHTWLRGRMVAEENGDTPEDRSLERRIISLIWRDKLFNEIVRREGCPDDAFIDARNLPF